MKKTVWIVNQYASTPEFGFAGRHYYLGKELAKQGYNVYLIASAGHHLLRKKPSVRSKFRIQREANRFNVVWTKMPHYSQAHSKIRVIGWFLFSWRIRELAKIIPDPPDVVICSSPSLLSFLGARDLARKFRAKLVFEVRDIWPMTLVDIGGYSSRHPFIRLLQWVEDMAYRESNRVVSNLENSIEHMINRGMEREKFAWVPNGFSMDEVELNVKLNDKASEQLPSEKFIIGYTGTLGVANALGCIIDVAENLRKFSDIAFVLVGDGKQKQELQLQAREKGLTNVHFVDPIPKAEVQAMLSQFDACYIGWLNDPLYRFGIGANKIPEYLYSGKPIIHAFSGSCDPILKAGAGIQVPAEVPKELADAVLKLYNMSLRERTKIGTKGRNAAIEQYEYGQLAEKLAKVLFD